MPGFKFKLSNRVGYYIINELEKTSMVRTCFTSRIGGISKGSFSTLNLGYKSGDLVPNITENFKILCGAAGFKLEDMVLSDQVHGDKCRVVVNEDRGKGIVLESDIAGVDALITNERDVALCIFTADCVPVFLLEKKNRVIALCHAGWRGIVNEIVPKTISTMVSAYGVNPQDIIAAIGPSIGPCCFNVGREVVEEFKKQFGNSGGIIINEGGNYKINLWEAVMLQLVSRGISRNCIYCSDYCTSCDERNFYSYRRDGSTTGRMMSIMQLV